LEGLGPYNFCEIFGFLNLVKLTLGFIREHEMKKDVRRRNPELDGTPPTPGKGSISETQSRHL
jgi:hypothetical protein